MSVNPADGAEPYPEDRVIGIFDRLEDARTAVEALTETGFPEQDITVLCGEAGVEFLDVQGADHGVLGRIVRTVQRFGMEREQLEDLAAELRQGHFAVGTRVSDDAGKHQVAELIDRHHGRDIRYYGRWTIERLTDSR